MNTLEWYNDLITELKQYIGKEIPDPISPNTTMLVEAFNSITREFIVVGQNGTRKIHYLEFEKLIG